MATNALAGDAQEGICAFLEKRSLGPGEWPSQQTEGRPSSGAGSPT